MSKINWKLAPEGAIGVAQRGQQLAFVDNDRNIFLDGHWGISMGWELVAKRPTLAESITKTPQLEQQKTVADAYEWANGEWKRGMLAICKCNDNLFFCDNNLRMREVICTREQFEAYAKEQEAKQEGEKWTHTYFNIRCRIMDLDPDEFGTVVIIKNGGDYALAHPSKLKPIKPTIKPSAAWSLVSKQGWPIHQVTETYDVEEVPAND